MALPGEDWSGVNIPDLFRCAACGKPYDTQREADLCTPAFLIPVIYGPQKPVEPEPLSITWLEEE